MCGSKQKIDGGLAEAIQALDSKVLLVLLGIKQAVATFVTRTGQAVVQQPTKLPSVAQQTRTKFPGLLTDLGVKDLLLGL